MSKIKIRNYFSSSKMSPVMVLTGRKNKNDQAMSPVTVLIGRKNKK